MVMAIGVGFILHIMGYVVGSNSVMFHIPCQPRKLADNSFEVVRDLLPYVDGVKFAMQNLRKENPPPKKCVNASTFGTK